MLAANQSADRVLGDVRREYKEGDRDKPLRAALSILREPPGARKPPDNDHRRETLDHRVETEPQQRHRTGERSSSDSDRALGRHIHDAQPRKRLSAPNQTITLLGICSARNSGAGARAS